ncbi:hypothetical protein [Streptomyces sp. NRRL S-1824]|uniref:hypothetical protein n=1 Tax=Streptomyces sp. NRRL S-1824 TaxID=1463889 RepID=UPI00131B053E|nr:hypothetical protein [Streptomyces sp. NRRL S-1824]
MNINSPVRPRAVLALQLLCHDKGRSMHNRQIGRQTVRPVLRGGLWLVEAAHDMQRAFLPSFELRAQKLEIGSGGLPSQRCTLHRAGKP